MIFNKVDIENILQSFATGKKLFPCEAQFQFELALEIKKRFPNYNVHLEFPSEKAFSNGRHSYYDLVVQDGNEYYVIELKYKTKKASILYKGINIDLKNQAAQDLGRFDYLQDIVRIENWGYNNPGKKFVGGCEILLTNDPVYWNYNGAGCNYQAFSLQDKTTIVAGQKKWAPNTPVTSTGKNRSGGLTINNNYKIVWKDYCQGFRYLMESV